MKMIARFWRGVTQAKDYQAYLDYLNRTGVHEILKFEGNQGIHLLHRVNGEEAEFLFISFWDSYDSIRKFAGPDVDIPVYYPDDRKYLRTLEPKVLHFELAKFDVPRGEAASIQAK
jgi:heme-degrading monooxygenase HmoA